MLGKNYEKINETLVRLGESYPRCAFVSAKGLSSNEDNLHFSAEALEEFGLRYYEAYRRFDRPDENAPTVTFAERSEMELL